MLFSYHLLYFCTALSLIIMLSSHYHHHKSKTFSQLTQCPFTGTLLLLLNKSRLTGNRPGTTRRETGRKKLLPQHPNAFYTLTFTLFVNTICIGLFCVFFSFHFYSETHIVSWHKGRSACQSADIMVQLCGMCAYAWTTYPPKGQGPETCCFF